MSILNCGISTICLSTVQLTNKTFRTSISVGFLDDGANYISAKSTWWEGPHKVRQGFQQINCKKILLMFISVKLGEKIKAA